MVQAIIIKPYHECCDIRYIFCPLCNRIIPGDGAFEMDDYVGNNCLFWCNNCKEILVCPTGCNSYDCTFDDLDTHECSVRLSDIELKELCDGKQCEGKQLISKDVVVGYKIGVLKINYILPHEHYENDDISEEDMKLKLEKYIQEREKQLEFSMEEQNLMKKGFHLPGEGYASLNEIRNVTNNRLEHDGMTLYYSGSCSNCSKQYSGYIWGD